MEEKDNLKIKIIEEGPYEVIKEIPLDQAIIDANNEGESKGWKKGKSYDAQNKNYYLCRCGHSKNKPYCDSIHKKINFTGKEVADKKLHESQAKKYHGKGLTLIDYKNLCAGARFCDPDGSVWMLTIRSDYPENDKIAIKEACDCPSGRLTIVKKDGTKIEPVLEKEISLIEDVFNNFRGPLWVKGEIPIEGADGETYEVRNRVTLCRCGESKNMPFCDVSHYNCPHMEGVDN